MPIRPKQHQLEDLSRRRFEELLPASWVMRNKDKDYGIDVEVEIFENGGSSTGLVFLVQLKATESTDKKVAQRIDLKIDALNYYYSFNIPVLLARYSADTDVFYFKWAHEVDLYYAKENAKTVRVTFDKKNAWTEESPLELRNLLEQSRYLRGGGVSFPVKVNFQVEDKVVNNLPRAVLLNGIRKHISLFSDYITQDRNPKKALFTADITGSRLKVSCLRMKGLTLHNIDDRIGANFVEELVDDILIGVAISLFQVSKYEMGAQILFAPKLKKKFFQREELVAGLIPALLQTSFFDEVIDTINDFTKNENSNILEVTLLGALVKRHTSSVEKKQKIERYLLSCITRAKNTGYKNLEASYQYNLANHYRSKNENRKATFHYFKARKLDADYLIRDYFWSELAGVLFGVERFKASAYCYQKALDLGAKESIKSLLADALMFSGKYQKALDVFYEYLDSTSDECDEWNLKCICLDSMIENYGVKEQVRRPNKACGMLKNLDVDVSSQCEAAFELDMLCGLAWFNAAIQDNKKGDKVSAALRFTMCAVIQNWDIEAWVNASLLSFSEKRPSSSMFILIVRTAYFFGREEFIEKLYVELEKQGHPEMYNELTSLIEEILPKDEDNQDAVVRIYGKDGLVLKF